MISTLTTSTETTQEVMAVDLSDTGIEEQRRRLASIVADPKVFLKKGVQRLQQPTKVKVWTRSFKGQPTAEEFPVLAIVANGKADGGSIVLDVNHRSRGLPVVVTRRALVDPGAWNRLKEAPKAEPAS